jgi:glyoxylase-like metal-dependent hydrolase (beta-lactamase superfamily II)
MHPNTNIHTIDLNFMGISNAIAAYLIPHNHGAVLVECGPGSTQTVLTTALAKHGYKPADISDVLLSHIHLDHAGAAGWLARQGAHIHVHHVGAPHMISPEKLIKSATRIYGDMMDTLWGDFLPVPESQLSMLDDIDEIEIEGLVFKALDTPGHAYHHMAYLLDGYCFSGDVGGVRMHTPGMRHVRIPTPPPEFHIEKWRQSLQRLGSLGLDFIAPTHYGIFDDPDKHLAAAAKGLDDIEAWMEMHIPKGLSTDKLENEVASWERERALDDGIPADLLDSYEKASPAWMSAAGLQRYWRKYRENNPS